MNLNPFSRKGIKKVSLNDSMKNLIKSDVSEISQGDKEKILKKLSNAMKGNGKSYNLVSAYTSMYNKALKDRKNIRRDIEKVSDNWLVHTITEQVIEDALAPGVQDRNIVTVSYTGTDKKIANVMDILNTRIDFSKLSTYVAREAFKYSHYLFETDLKTVKDDKFDDSEDFGLMSLNDDMIQDDVMALNKGSELIGYLQESNRTKFTSELTLHPTSSYIQFIFDTKIKKVKLEGNINKKQEKEFESLPTFLNVGVPDLHVALPKISDLELLEMMVPASKLDKLSRGTLVGVNVPAGMNPEAAMETVRDVEETINSKLAIDFTKGEMSFEKILDATGRLKCVPMFGDSKGSLQSLNYDSQEPDDLLRSVNDIRKVICQTFGIPFEVIFSDERAAKGHELFKKYSRYTRKLLSVQRMIRNGYIEIIKTDLYNRGYKDLIKEEDFSIEFKNKIISTDILESLEFSDTIVSMLQNMTRFITDISSQNSKMAPLVNITEYAKYVNLMLEGAGITGVINTDMKEEELTKLLAAAKESGRGGRF